MNTFIKNNNNKKTKTYALGLAIWAPRVALKEHSMLSPLSLQPFHFNVPGRQLKKEGSIDRLVLKENSRQNRVKPYKTQLYLFVFTDLLMITSKDKNRKWVPEVWFWHVNFCKLYL